MTGYPVFHFYMNEVEAFENSIDAFKNAGDTIIGNDVWIGGEAMIMPGVKVGMVP